MKENSSFSNLVFLKELETDSVDSFEKLWRACVNNDLMLTNDEAQALLPLGTSLGSTDIEGQSAALNLAIERFSSMLEYERKKTPEKARLYMSMGVLCGAAAAVLMI